MFLFIRAIGPVAALFVIVPAVGLAQPTRVALSGVTPAQGTGVFTSFDHAPSVFGGVVAFQGMYPGGQGVYSWTTGDPSRVANSATPLPGGGTFNVFGTPATNGSTVVFSGGQAIGVPAFIPFHGVYAGSAFGIVTVADTSTASPSGGGNFGGFAPPAVSGSNAVFLAGNPTVGGIYTRQTTGTGTVTKVVDTMTTIPGVGGPFGNFLLPSIDGTRVAFTGFGPGGGGVFTAATPGGPLSIVATTATPIPGGGGNFIGLGAPAVSASTVVFTGGPTGGGAPPTGVYAYTIATGSLAVVANTNTSVPVSTGLKFTQFDPQVSLFGDDVVFVGRSAAGPGIYTNATGPLTRIVGAGDTFDGHTVADLGIGKQSFDGTVLTFWASFTDGSSGIYVVPVPVPEPAGVLAISAAGAGLLWRVRRRLA